MNTKKIIQREILLFEVSFHMKVAQPFSKSIWQMEDKLIHSIVKLLINPFGLKYVSITKGKSYVSGHLINDFPGFIA